MEQETSTNKLNLLILSFKKKLKLKNSLLLTAITAFALVSFQLSPKTPAASNIPRATATPSPTPIPTPPLPIPTIINNTPTPSLSAKGAIIIDADSSAVLYEKSADQRLMPASTTKIMTAIIALENYHLDDLLTITEEERTIGQTMKLEFGEQLTVKDLLFGALVNSGNDAALALALSFPKGGYNGFLEAMNAKATDLGLQNTSYKNVSGVESVNHFTTARDLAKLAQYAMNNKTFKEIVATPSIRVSAVDGKTTHQLFTTNSLLGSVDGVVGIKTGWTENAGECLVSSTIRNKHHIITVVLGSSDRFGETESLIDWVFNNHKWNLPKSSNTLN